MTRVKIEEALATMRAYPKDPQAWLTLGAVLANTGDIPKAKQCYEHALVLDPEFSRARLALQAIQALEDPTPVPEPSSLQTATLFASSEPEDSVQAQPAEKSDPVSDPSIEADPAQGIRSYIIPGETLYATYSCTGPNIDIVGITDQRVIFQDQAIVRDKVQIVSLPYNHIIAVASAVPEITLLTPIGNFTFAFHDRDKADWVYRFVMHQLLHQTHPQLPG